MKFNKLFVGPMVGLMLLAGSVFAVTVTDKRADGAGTGAPAYANSKTAVAGYTLDVSTLPLGAGDSVKLVTIPAKSQIESVYYRVSTVNSTSSVPVSATFKLGDSTTVSNFTQTAVQSSNLTDSCILPASFVTTKYYTSADYVTLTAVDAITNAVIKVFVKYTCFN